MLIKKPIAYLFYFLFFSIAIQSIPAIASEQVNRENLNTLADQVKNAYQQLVEKQAARPESGKESAPHDWMRDAYTLGNAMKEDLKLNAGTIKGGLRQFYKNFLIKPEQNFKNKILAVARMQAATSDPNKQYSWMTFDKSKVAGYEGAIIVEGYQPLYGPKFDVTPYNFFVGALNEVPKMELSNKEAEQVQKNLQSFKQAIDQNMGK